MSTRYDNVQTRTTEAGINFLTPVFYPKVEVSEDDLYIISTDGDRYDNLSLEFYGRVDYWWVVMVANLGTINGDSLAIEPGIQIRIPENPEDYIRRYQEFNS